MFQLQHIAKTVEMQFPAPKCCKYQGKQAEKQIQKKCPKRKKIIPKTIPDQFLFIP
jgi:hypothetical protein